MIEELPTLTSVVLQQQQPMIDQAAAAALAMGLAGIGAGIAERGIGAAAVGALAEDSLSLGLALLMTVIPETLVILALVAFFI